MKMFEFRSDDLYVSVDPAAGRISSLVLKGKERLAGSAPLFRLGLRDPKGEQNVLTAYDARAFLPAADGGVYGDFEKYPGLSVSVSLRRGEIGRELEWRIAVDNVPSDILAEWVDFPLLVLPATADNDPDGTGGRILLPYNEGVLVSDAERRETTDFRHSEPGYPSLGNYWVFPNMLCSQFMAYLWDDCGLYIGAHDPNRGLKQLDFYPAGGGVALQLRLYTGTDPGEAYRPGFPVVWSVTGGQWQSAADRYRAWFETHLPPDVRKITDNTDLPDWYSDLPLVVSYPVRGIHDMDEMAPNKLYPYAEALPLLEDIAAATGSRLLVLLMHWEGTAPWAPPYVWPPFGGEDEFNAFTDALHTRGMLLGVYCSGFGYTEKSNLIESYDRSGEIAAKGLTRAMCAGPDGVVRISRICTGQRSGYDICPASELGRGILDEAYAPLFGSGLDYAQILDQNHGGGQYLCFSRAHGHPAAPGAWMTANMRAMLSGWKRRIAKRPDASRMLLGCESAAAEPFIGNLEFSDNRFELNYYFGVPVPLYAYVYHEYLRNFMGNQVSLPFPRSEDTLRDRIAYSFCAGDAPTLVLTPEGELSPAWGTRDFSNLPDKAAVLKFIANLTRFYRTEARQYLFGGRMIEPLPLECGGREIECLYWGNRVTLPDVCTSAWEASDGSRAQVVVNPGLAPASFSLAGNAYTLEPLGTMLVPIE